LNGKLSNISRIISVVVIRIQFPDEENGEGYRNISSLAVQPHEAAASPSEIYILNSVAGKVLDFILKSLHPQHPVIGDHHPMSFS
jgi:hypothetical protein